MCLFFFFSYVPVDAKLLPTSRLRYSPLVFLVSLLAMSLRSMLPLSFALLACLAAAQDTSIINPTTAAPSVTPLPSAHGYTYAGCWNETLNVPNSGGERALSDMAVGG